MYALLCTRILRSVKRVTLRKGEGRASVIENDRASSIENKFDKGTRGGVARKKERKNERKYGRGYEDKRERQFSAILQVLMRETPRWSCYYLIRWR
jgi:hypothetical protein